VAIYPAFDGKVIRQGERVNMKPIPTQDERQLLWERVNDTVLRCSEKLVSAKIAADFSGIGHACRDGLTTLAQAIWEPERHPVTDVGNVC
jgi:hypothetical protein